jgi:hypothetical protein
VELLQWEFSLSVAVAAQALAHVAAVAELGVLLFRIPH